MLLQVPQYLLITLGEIGLSVTGYDFAYTQVKALSFGLIPLRLAVGSARVTFKNPNINLYSLPNSFKA
jgi:hypothetical protein